MDLEKLYDRMLFVNGENGTFVFEFLRRNSGVKWGSIELVSVLLEKCLSFVGYTCF